jgi:hypothetical protein
MHSRLERDKLAMIMHKFIPISFRILVEDLFVTELLVQVFYHLFSIIRYRHTLKLIAVIRNVDSGIRYVTDCELTA